MRRRWLPVFVAVAALIVVGIAAQGTGVEWRQGEAPLQVENTGEPLPVESMPAEESVEPSSWDETDDSSALPGWVSWLVLGIIVGVPALLIIAFVTRRLVQWLLDARATEPRAEVEVRHQRRDVALVEQAVEAGLAEIDFGTDPRSAIIACWVHFERAADEVGIERESSDTPADLVRKLLVSHELDGGALARLSEAYLLARYSPHDVGEADRDRARDAITALGEQLGVREVR